MIALDMTPFSHIRIPSERHPTAAAQVSLSSQLGFKISGDVQDWERHFQNFDKIGEFVDLYEQGQLDDDKRFLLMELILASASDGNPAFFASAQWRRIEQLLTDHQHVHVWSIWFWSSIDEESRLAYNDFAISPYMQALLCDMASVQQDGEIRRGTAGGYLAIEFGKFWWRNFNSLEPAAYKLRVALKDRWVRFHTLPQSKRPPQTQAELTVAVGRAMTLANDILEQGEQCWMVVNSFADGPPIKDDAIDKFSLKPCYVWWEPDEPLQGAEMVTYVASCQWSPARFEEILGKVTTGDEAQLFWVSKTSATVFAPCDGGVDLILPKSNQSRTLATKYPNWLSSFPGGL